jgi:hypothetical protein
MSAAEREGRRRPARAAVVFFSLARVAKRGREAAFFSDLDQKNDYGTDRQFHCELNTINSVQ